MEMTAEIIQNLYAEINSIEIQGGPNDAKANSLRKQYERLIKIALCKPENTRFQSLSTAIDQYISKEKRFDLHSVCRKLCNDLNKWSHDNPQTLSNEEFNNYCTRLMNIVQSITEISPEHLGKNQEQFPPAELKLNKKQKVAVESTKRITLVTAGPGTGKTHLLVGRILYELYKRPSIKIAGLSFTNTAADELREKVTTWIFSTCLVEHKDNVISGTIHSFALRLIQKFYEFMDKPFDYIIVDDAEEKDIRALFKNNKDAIDNYYLENKILTFDRIIQLFNYSAKQNSDFREFIAKEVDEIVIDEAQDLNLEQYEMLWLLYENNPELKLFFVADQRQNIYGFRKGALRVNQTFGEKNVHNVDLELSYRCPQKILDFVNTFEFDDCNNVELKNHAGNQGSNLFIICFENQKDEAEWIASNLEREKITGKALLDNAIIYPNSFYFEEILKALNKHNLSFRVFGGEYFLDDDIKLFRVLLNFINTENQYALQSILHQCGEYSLGVENVGQALERIRSYESNSDLSFKAIECLLFAMEHRKTELSPLEILEKFAQLISEKEILAKNSLNTYEQLKDVICNDLNLNDYHKLKFSITPKHPELGKFYKRSDQIVPCKNVDDPDYITVATVHSAKGLQWETVYIPGLHQGGFPRWFSKKETEEREMPHELKKFYVSCTRARENLWLTRPKKVTVVSRKDQKKYTFDKPKSHFVRELKELYKDRNILK